MSIRRRWLPLLLLAGATTFTAPLAAQAGGGDHGLVLSISPPLEFVGTTGDCPEGVITFGLAKRMKDVGSGTACIKSVTPAPCDGVCQIARSRWTLELRRCTITLNLTIFETFAADFSSLVQAYGGTVTSASRKCSDLLGGAVSGGGTIVFGEDGSLAPVNLVIAIEGEDADD